MSTAYPPPDLELPEPYAPPAITDPPREPGGEHAGAHIAGPTLALELALGSTTGARVAQDVPGSAEATRQARRT